MLGPELLTEHPAEEETALSNNTWENKLILFPRLVKGIKKNVFNPFVI